MPAPAITPAPTPAAAHPLDAWDAAASSPTTFPIDRLRRLGIAVGPYALIAVIALISRLRYAWWGYHDTFGSGDAHLIITKAWFIRHGQFEPSAVVGPPSDIFGSPPLIPFLLAGFSFVTGASVAAAALIVGTALTIIALLALYALATKAMDRTVALVGVGLVALLPRFALDSTEPDKVAYVLSFSIIALWLLYEGQRRSPSLLLAGVCMGLAVFSHTTAYLFIPVFMLAHVALSQAAWRRILNPWFLAGCAVIAAFFAGYVALDDHYSPTVVYDWTATSTTPSAGTLVPPAGSVVESAGGFTGAEPRPDSRFVPNVIENYWRNLKGLATDGFRDSAWDLYFDGIRGQLLDPMYILAIAGFVIAGAVMVRQRRLMLAPLLLWMLIVTLGFAIQRPAPSHTSRYPSYVSPVFVLMAVFGILTAARWIAGRMKWDPAYALALAVPFVAWAAVSYATAPEQGTRRLYQGHREAAEYINDRGVLSDGNELLYLGWPSYTYYLLDGGADLDDVHTFGWQPGVLAQVDADYIERNRVRYVLHDELLDDYFKSSALVTYALTLAYDFREVETFCSGPSSQGCASRVILYKLTPRTDLAAATP